MSTRAKKAKDRGSSRASKTGDWGRLKRGKKKEMDVGRGTCRRKGIVKESARLEHARGEQGISGTGSAELQAPWTAWYCCLAVWECTVWLAWSWRAHHRRENPTSGRNKGTVGASSTKARTVACFLVWCWSFSTAVGGVGAAAGHSSNMAVQGFEAGPVEGTQEWNMEDRGAVEEHAEPRGAAKEPSIATLVTVRKNWQVAGFEAVVQSCKMERQLNKEGGISGLEAGLALLGVVIALRPACRQYASPNGKSVEVAGSLLGLVIGQGGKKG